MDPSPFLPSFTPLTMARIVALRGPSTVSKLENNLLVCLCRKKDKYKTYFHRLLGPNLPNKSKSADPSKLI